MTTAQIQAMQSRVGAKPDGFWGPKSIAACQKHLRSFMPSPNPWPAATTAACTTFYGEPGDTSRHVRIEVPYPMYLYSHDGARVKTITVNKACANSLSWILAKIADTMSAEQIARAGMDLFFGCFNYRNVRGGASLSKHAWAAAVDFDANRNGNKTAWPVRAHMPIEVMEIFAVQGWMSAGAFWGRDAMHFQATK